MSRKNRDVFYLNYPSTIKEKDEEAKNWNLVKAKEAGMEDAVEDAMRENILENRVFELNKETKELIREKIKEIGAEMYKMAHFISAHCSLESYQETKRLEDLSKKKKLLEETIGIIINEDPMEWLVKKKEKKNE